MRLGVMAGACSLSYAVAIAPVGLGIYAQIAVIHRVMAKIVALVADFNLRLIHRLMSY